MRPVSTTLPVGAESTAVSSQNVRAFAATKPAAQAAISSHTGLQAPRWIPATRPRATLAAAKAREPCGSTGKTK